MTDHLTRSQIDQFAARILPASDLSVLARHLSACWSCRQLFQETHEQHPGNAQLAFSLAPEMWLKHEHLEYEQLAPYIDGSFDSEEREIVELHLNSCAQCREDVQSLREFRRQIAPEMDVSYAPTKSLKGREKAHRILSWSGWRWKPVYAAAMAVAFIVIALVLTISLRDKRAVDQPAQVLMPKGEDRVINPENNSVVAPPMIASNVSPNVNAQQAKNKFEKKLSLAKDSSQSPLAQTQTPKHSTTMKLLNSPSDAIALNDGNETISLDESGRVTGTSNLTPANAQIVRETLLAQNIAKPQDVAQIIGERGTLRGDGSQARSFKLLSPARAVVTNNRPTFKWEAMSGATGYRVYVGDANNREVTSSEELSSSVTEWTPRTALPRGKIYTWAVIARVGGKEVIAPAASEPEVRFKVLSEGGVRELMRLENRTRSHLILGIFYARAGMIKEAEREFQLLVKQNPRSPVALKLLRSVRSWR